MFEKVNPSHPDKVADRIAGAMVDLAYKKSENPKVAIEVLIGHGECYVVAETSVDFEKAEVEAIVKRIAGNAKVSLRCVRQDEKLAGNQKDEIRCGDNGIFKGAPVTPEQERLTWIARQIYDVAPTDGKYLMDGDKLVICQSNCERDLLERMFPEAIINPLGDWTGGTDVDCGCTNRKIGSDLGDAVTGGGLHGKDLSKADVSITIYAYLKSQKSGRRIELSCAIGDDEVDGLPYSEIVKIAKGYIDDMGGFERLAEWGLI